MSPVLLFAATAVHRFIPRPSFCGNTTTLRTIYDGANAWADFSNTNVLQTRYLFTRAIDEVLARLSSTSILAWDLPDILGSVRDISDGAGTAVLDHVKYDSYGNILSESSPSSGDRFKYTAREWDTATSQYFYRARYYTASAGRFTSQDPLGFGGDNQNMAAYCANTPNSYVDENGRDETPKGKPHGKTHEPITPKTTPKINHGTPFQVTTQDGQAVIPEGAVNTPPAQPKTLVIPPDAIALVTGNTVPGDREGLIEIIKPNNPDAQVPIDPVKNWSDIIETLRKVNEGNPVNRPVVISGHGNEQTRGGFVGTELGYNKLTPAQAEDLGKLLGSGYLILRSCSQATSARDGRLPPAGLLARKVKCPVIAATRTVYPVNPANADEKGSYTWGEWIRYFPAK